MNEKISYDFNYRVRYADTDKMQVMYNGQYLTLFEIGRTEMLRHVGLPYASFEKQGYMLPVIEAHIFYKNPAFYDDELCISTSFDAKRSAILTINYVILRADLIIAEGTTKHSFMDEKTRKAIRPPAVFLHALEYYLSCRQ